MLRYGAGHYHSLSSKGYLGDRNFDTLFRMRCVCWIAILLLHVLATPTLAQESIPTMPATAAEVSNTKEVYLSGIQAFQANQFQEAATRFAKAAQTSPDNKLLLYNWGLAEYQAGNWSQAVALWRRVIYLDPDFSAAERAMEYAERSGKVPRGRVETSTYDWLRSSVLNRFSLEKALLFLALVLATSGYLMLRYLGARRAAIADNLPLPKTPTVAAGLTALFILSLCLVILKAWDDFQPRATVIKELLAVRSAPSLSAPELFNISGGAEVKLKSTVPGWAQVAYPGGLIGWVETAGLYPSSGRRLW